jgi:hypothetical protein
VSTRKPEKRDGTPNSFAAESVIEMNLPVLLFSTALAVVTAIVGTCFHA